MKYKPIERLSIEEVESAISGNDPEDLLIVVLSAALYSDDQRWAEDICLKLSKHEHFNVRGNAILGFGHIARIHRRLDQRKVQPVLEAALKDPSDYVRGQADVAADDVEFFLNWKVDRQLKV
jgi:hypothetical protein